MKKKIDYVFDFDTFLASSLWGKIFLEVSLFFKVQLIWEGHKNLRNLPYGFDIYLLHLKPIRQIAQIFVAFSEKVNFTTTYQGIQLLI